MFGNILTRYIFRELVQVFAFTLFVLTMIFFVIFTGQMVHKYSRYASLLDIVALTPYTLLMSASFTIPLAMLAATTMVYGRMAHEKEVLVLRIAGVHFHRMFEPAFLLGAILCTVCFYINGWVVPMTLSKQKELKSKALDMLINSSFSVEETTVDFIPNVVIYYRSLKDGQFQGLIMSSIDEEQRVTEQISAESGYLVYDVEKNTLNFHLQNITVMHVPRSSGNDAESEERFDSGVWDFPLQLEDKEEKIPDRPKYKDMGLLYYTLQRAKEEIRSLERESAAGQANPTVRQKIAEAYRHYTQHLMEWHRRWVSAITPLLVVFLGAPLGILVRHNNRLVAFGAGALPVILCYYPLQILGRAMGESGTLSPFWAEWLASLVIMAMGTAILGWVYRK